MAKFIPRFTAALERLASRSNLLYRGLSLYYKNLVKQEVTLAGIQPGDKVLCVGGGPSPFSAILIHEYTGAEVTIIDNENHSVDIAQELIKKLGYSEAIKVSYGDGRSFSPRGYTVIQLAVQISPMDKVFGHLLKNSKLGTRILMRVPRKSLTGFYDAADPSIFPCFQAEVVHRCRNIGSTLLFVVGAEKQA